MLANSSSLYRVLQILVALMVAAGIVVASAHVAKAYWISPSFTGASGIYYFPDPGCFTQGEILSAQRSAWSIELSGTCTSDIGTRAWSSNSSWTNIAWAPSYSAAVVSSGTVASYKIYHKDKNGN